MALSQSTLFSSLTVPFHNQNPRTVILQTPTSKSISSFRTVRSKPSSPLLTISCFAGAVPEDGNSEASSLSTSISSVFVKGLSDSVSEGRLKKVFSDFGEVCNVKIIINEKTRQSLGYGYVWFNSKEDAELAVEAMNGKVYSC